MSITPLHDRVLVRRKEEENTTAGGIVIPEGAKEKSSYGTIIATGSGKVLDNGEIHPLSVNKGDGVLFGKYSGTEVKVDDEELLIMREDDILAIVGKK